MRTSLILFLVGVCLTACAQKTNRVNTEFKKLEWLVGTWNGINSKPGRSAHERWEKINDYELQGFGVNFKGTDTVFVEKLKIIQRNDTIYYVADVPENKGLVYFRMTTLSDTGFVCENPSHDFPKKISYFLKDQSLKAQISGDGKEIDYFFEREK